MHTDQGRQPELGQFGEAARVVLAPRLQKRASTIQ